MLTQHLVILVDNLVWLVISGVEREINTPSPTEHQPEEINFNISLITSVQSLATDSGQYKPPERETSLIFSQPLKVVRTLSRK